MTTIADYAGRYIDVMAYQGVRTGGDNQLAMSLAATDDGGKICTGAQKLAQRFVLRLFTQRGSMPYRPDEGCDFMTRLLAGQLRTSLDVYAEFGAAVIDIRKSMRVEETDERVTRGITPDPEEIMTSAELTGVRVTPGNVVMQITITSRAGTSRKIILPIATTLRGEP